MNKLPQYWQVQHDGSELFNNTVVKYLNTFVYDGDYWVGNGYESFYGVKSLHILKGFCETYQQPGCTLLTLNKFIELTRPFIYGR